ncbi:phosphocholine cytidylyltransferase family protein [Candidatus Woesearchaeota archaeon]|nr:phosphocholine cytidylyltransferase family protein [Candidatus Woesearchaeota archaeon]
MKAIILAAGRSTRLLPLTKNVPQCLLEISGKKILKLQKEALNAAGIGEIYVVSGHLANQVEEECKKEGITCLLNPFYEVSGIAMTLWVVRDYLKDGFILLYSDILFDRKIISLLLENKSDICLAIKKDVIRDEAEKVFEQDEIIKDVDKGKIKRDNGEFIGIAKFSHKGAEKLIGELNDEAKKDIQVSFINVIRQMIRKGEKITALDIGRSFFIDIDFPEDLEKAKKIIAKGC